MYSYSLGSIKNISSPIQDRFANKKKLNFPLILHNFEILISTGDLNDGLFDYKVGFHFLEI